MEFQGKIKNHKNYSQEDLHPKFANDLTVKEVTLSMRQKALDNLNRIKKSMKDLETSIIMQPKTEDRKADNKLKFQLLTIKRMIDQYQIKSQCEICSAKIEIYSNLCHTKTTGVVEDLAILRNVLIRIDYLINQISSSLSNQLDKEELTEAIYETQLLEKLF